MQKSKVFYIDGSSTGLYGFYDPETNQMNIFEDYPCTNNQGEWLALYSLVLTLPECWSGVVYSDSQLIVNQFNGNYKIKNLELKRIHDLVKTVCSEKNLKLELKWVPREQNIAGKKIEKELAHRKVKVWEHERIQAFNRD